MKVNPHIFRAYDVRGKVGSDLTPEVVRLVGRAYASLIRRKGGGPQAGREMVSGKPQAGREMVSGGPQAGGEMVSGKPEAGREMMPGREINAGGTIALGQDNRLPSGDLKAAFAEGVQSAGVSILDIGLSPTPVLYFATAHWKLDGGANITGSHNPIEYNGIKMVHPGAAPLTEDEIQSLRAMIEIGDFETGSGAVTQRSPRQEYFDLIGERIRLGRRLKVVVDAGNGVAGLFAPDLLRRLGLEVVELHCESDGRFPNHLPDPEIEENVRDLQAKVVEVGADLGIAYDGDADRMGVVDEQGQRHEADFVLILLARDLLTRHPGATVLFDVKCSQNVADDIGAHGGIPKMWKTGHSHLKRKMREDGILLGGEVSGHMFFAEDYYGIDDGIYASAKLIEIVSRSPNPLSAHFATIPRLHVTPELKAPCPDDKKFQVVAEIAEEFKGQYETIDIDGARVLFPGGWGLVRASNTNPYLTLRFEAKTLAQLQEMKRIVFARLSRYTFVTLPS